MFSSNFKRVKCVHIMCTLVMYYFSCPRCCWWGTGSYGLLWRYCLWWYSFEELTVCSVYCSHLSKLGSFIDMQVFYKAAQLVLCNHLQINPGWFTGELNPTLYTNASGSNGCNYIYNCCKNHFSYFSYCLALYFSPEFLIIHCLHTTYWWCWENKKVWKLCKSWISFFFFVAKLVEM